MSGLVLVGASHHTAPLEVRERLAVTPDLWYAATGARVLTVLLATCNRVEAYAWCDDDQADQHTSWLVEEIANLAGTDPAALRPHLRLRAGQAALTHLVRVVAGLDALVVGEEQIRGQVVEALARARNEGALPAALDGAFTRALEAGRRLRAVSPVGHHPSVAAAGVAVALDSPELAGGLSGRRVLVLGAGTMARAATVALLETGAEVTLCGRTAAHAERLAGEFAGGRVTWAPWSSLAALAAEADLIVGATAARQPVVDPATLHRRPAGRALVLLDIALPRDIHPAVRALPDVRVIDLDDLERQCPVDLTTRRAEVARAEARAVQEAEQIGRWLRARAAAPAIVDLRRRADAIRADELARAESRLAALTPEQRQAVDRLTRAIVQKLLHEPLVHLRESAPAAGERPQPGGPAEPLGARRA